MIIGVDAGSLGVRDERLKVGVYYVSYYLVLELAKIDKKNTYILYSFEPIERSLLRKLPKNWKNKILPKVGWFRIWLPLQLFLDRPQLFLALNQSMPWFHPFRTIGFIHGLDFLKKFHEYGNNLKKLQTNTSFLVKHADALVTTSQFLKKSIETKYKKKNVDVIPLGIDGAFYKNTTSYALDRPYFLFVGSIKPSKNIPTLLQAFSVFVKKTKQSYYLLCIGSNYWVDKKVGKMIHELGIEKDVLTQGAVPQSQLPQYYRGAVAFVSPSLYEGFGLPFLEAMASGCPVIASSVGGIVETVADSGLLFRPKDVKGISRAMQKVAQDKQLRNSLIKKGQKLVKKFTWQNHATSIYSIINNYENSSK